MIDAIELKDVDRDRLRKCDKQTSIMYENQRPGIDEANMTFSYIDLIRLRMLYEWKPKTEAQLAEEKERILKDEALLFSKDSLGSEDGSRTKLEAKLAGDGEDGGKFDLYKSFERTLPFADIQLSQFIESV